MRNRFCLALAVAASALLALPAGAQTFQYSEVATGARSGTLTLNVVNSRPSTEALQVTLDVAGFRLQGWGARHLLDRGNYVLDFVLSGSLGEALFYEGTGTAGFGNQASGTFFRLGSQQTSGTWQISLGTPSDGSIINTTPALNEGWTPDASNDAPGRTYYVTGNRLQGNLSTATWSGQLPQGPGIYQIEVFIPRQLSQTARPRTNHARYVISTSSGPIQREIDQAVAASGWFSLGEFNLSGNQYQIRLGDETGEPFLTRVIVANAVRLTVKALP